MAYTITSRLKFQDHWKQWKENGDPEAKKVLIEKYLPLVDYVVGRMSFGMPKNVTKDELFSHGVLGLMDAVEKFDLERGHQFETYASWRIRGAILDGLRQGDWVPRSVRDKAKKLEEAYQALEQIHLRSVSDREVSDYLNVSEQEILQIHQDIHTASMSSLEEPIKDEEAETRLSLIVDETAKNPEYKVNEFFLKETLAKAIDKLTEKERTVVSLFYYEDLSLSEIAEVMSLTPSRISQLHAKAIQRLRNALDRNKSLLMQDM